MKISDIRIDDTMQSRAQVNAAVVAEYAERLMEGAKFPPVTVFFDGTDHWLADGFHRAFAYLDAGCKDIEAIVISGSRHDGALFSCGANKTHGLPRSGACKRKAVAGTIGLQPSWTNTEVAAHVGVTRHLVGQVRDELAHLVEQPSEDSGSTLRTYTTKHGTQATMNVAKIGKGKVKGNPPEAPPAEDPPPVQAEPQEPEVELDAMGQPMANWIKKEPPAEAQQSAAQPEAQPAKPSTKPAASADLRDKLQALQEERDAAVTAMNEALEENTRMGEAFDADDRTAALFAENQKLKAQVATLTLRVNGLMNEKNAAIRAAKSWQRKAEQGAAA